MKDDCFVAKIDMTLAGRAVHKGQLVRPAGNVHDQKLFGDATHWTYRYVGGEPEACGSDGCDAQFANLGLLDRHRRLAHGPEREGRERARIEREQAKVEREQAGETVGGHPVEKSVSGPGGPVPYIKNPFG